MRHLCSWSCKISSGRTTAPQTCYGRSCPSLASAPSPVLQATPSQASGLLPPKHVKWHRKGLIWVPQELPREGHLSFRMCSGSWQLGVQALLPATCPEGGAASRGSWPSRGDGAGSAPRCVQHPVLTPGCRSVLKAQTQRCQGLPAGPLGAQGLGNSRCVCMPACIRARGCEHTGVRARGCDVTRAPCALQTTSFPRMEHTGQRKSQTNAGKDELI